VKAATLTGSGPAGRAVASTAGDHFKKTVLELGGSDPYVVLDDADIEAAATTGAWARNLNGGQSCIAAKRFIVHDAAYEAFIDRFVTEIESFSVGDPMDHDTDVGPQARSDLMDGIHEQVTESVDAGATVLTGGEPLNRDGAYYPPTVLADVPSGCPVDAEEVFGPVAAVYRVPNEDTAIEKANETEFGLGASIWTNDLERGERIAGRIDAGCTYINELVKSDPRVPFGGVKESGYGRELSEMGIKEFLNAKTVYSDIVLSGADYHHTETLLNKNDRQYSEAYWDKKIFAPSSLIFYVGFDKKLKNVEHHTLFFDVDFAEHARAIYDDPQWPEEPLFYASFPSKTDDSAAPEGMEAGIFLIPLAPGLKDTQELRDLYFKKIMSRFETLTEQKVQENIRFRESFCVNDFIRDYNSYKGNAYGLANTLLQTAFLRPGLKSKKVERLFFTGQLSVPGPGVPPSLISGKLAANLIDKEILKIGKSECCGSFFLVLL
jgi:hypothetical protein